MIARMAHWDLLPTTDDLVASLVEEGIDETTVQRVLHAVAGHLSLYKDYFDDQVRMNGEQRDVGASDELARIAGEFRDV